MKLNPKIKSQLWNIQPGNIAYNCAAAGMLTPDIAMPMWERTGNRVFNFSGKYNQVSAVGTPEWVASGLYFDGVTEYLTFSTLNLTAFTITLKISAAYKNGWILTNGTAGSFIGRNSTGTFRIWDSGGNHDLTTDTYVAQTSETWTMTYDGTTYKYYINGIYKGYMTGIGNTFPVSRLNNCEIGSYKWAGTVDYNYIFPFAISDAQVRNLFHNPYFMFRQPEYNWGYAAGGPPETSIPAIMNFYRQLRAK